MSATRNDNPWWEFRELFNTKAARYRLYMVIAMAFFGQWSGNNVVNYFMPQMVKAAGITNPSTQLLINAINPIFSFLGALYGATLLDKLGRRVMLMAGLGGGLFAYILLTAFTAESETKPNLSYGTIVSIYLFGIFFAWVSHLPSADNNSNRPCGLRDTFLAFLFISNSILNERVTDWLHHTGLDTPPNPLRSRMSRKPHSSQRQRIKFPVPQRRHGRQYIRHQRWN